MVKIYLHETGKSLNDYIFSFKTKRLRKKKIKQMVKPDWCEYPDALLGIMGCWSLCFGGIKKEEDCGICEFKKKTMEAL